MHTLLRSTDPVLVSYVEALLLDAGLQILVADRNISAVEGGIGAFPCRVLVPADEAAQARRILVAAGLASHLMDQAS
jgi:hypothetical protein